MNYPRIIFWAIWALQSVAFVAVALSLCLIAGGAGAMLAIVVIGCYTWLTWPPLDRLWERADDEREFRQAVKMIDNLPEFLKGGE